MSKEEVNLKKYFLIFSGYYFVFMAVINILAHGFDIDLGSGANIAMLMSAGYGAAIKFVTDVGRHPSTKEKRLLSLGCLTASFLISALVFIIAIPVAIGVGVFEGISAIFSSISPAIWLGIFTVVGLLYYFALSIIFGWGARKYAEKSINRTYAGSE